MTDVAIIGGGGIGCAVAYFLKSLGLKDLSVTVFEKDPTYAAASTALAAGGLRQQFTTPESIEMSAFGHDFLSSMPEAGFRPIPYLLLGNDNDLPVLRESLETQTRLKTGASWLDRDDLATRYPWMNVDDVTAAILGGPREGIFDPYALLQALKRKARELGARFVEAEVTGIGHGPDGRCESLHLSDGSTVTCGVVVNAAGPAAGKVAALAGIDLPVVPLKAHTFVFRTRATLDDFPVVIDRTQGMNVRPEGDGFIVGVAPKNMKVEPATDFDIDYGLFDSTAWPALAHRVGAFDAVKMTGAWVGHIEWNSFDANAVIGPHPGYTNFYFANGFSGHGAQHIPAAGRAIAELVVYGAYQSLDLSRLGYERIAAGTPLREHC